MEVRVDNAQQAVRFGDVPVGGVYSFYEGYYMKLRRVLYDENGTRVNAVELGNGAGMATAFVDDSVVTLVHATLHVIGNGKDEQ